MITENRNTWPPEKRPFIAAKIKDSGVSLIVGHREGSFFNSTDDSKTSMKLIYGSNWMLMDDLLEIIAKQTPEVET